MNKKERELIEKLKQCGLDMGQWSNQSEKEVNLQAPTVLLDLLQQLRASISNQIKADSSKVAQLKEVEQRLKHGGGR